METSLPIQMPNPTPEQLAEIRRLLPQKTDNTQTLTEPYHPLHTYLLDSLALKLNGTHDQAVYTAGWSLLWCARHRLLPAIETTYTHARENSKNGDGGGHAALRQNLNHLGYRVASSHEAEQVAEAILQGQL
ncbi:MAG: hypothetical protein H6636_14270 [Anaerolineales bacterium]|nr:hypothetical protein [Anaerolineales bacterium]